MAETALMDLAVRSTPRGSEALGYATIVSVLNLSLMGGDWLGAGMLAVFHTTFDTLVYTNVATTLVTVPLALFLLKKENRAELGSIRLRSQ